jgi:flagellar protein FliJ
MSAALQPLLALLAQTERERDAAAADHRRAQSAHRQAEQQLGQLTDYQADYETRWRAQLREGATMDVLQCYQGFAGRLQEAVDQQARAVDLAAQRAAREQARLTEREIRVASVRRLIERRTDDLRRGIERREQKQLDEFASRAGWVRAAAQRPGATADEPIEAL